MLPHPGRGSVPALVHSFGFWFSAYRRTIPAVVQHSALRTQHCMEAPTGIEPAPAEWESAVLPLHHGTVCAGGHPHPGSDWKKSKQYEIRR